MEYRRFTNMKKQIDFAKNIPVKIVDLKMKIAAMDKTLQRRQEGEETNVQQELLGVVTGYCKENRIVLKEFPEAVQTEAENFLIQTNIFKIEGSFIKLLELIYILEQKKKLGKIASVFFQTKTDVKTKSVNLTAAIYLQYVSKLRNNE